jgi:uncharacterized membrane protein YqgA involved in biofilm formation
LTLLQESAVFISQVLVVQRLMHSLLEHLLNKEPTVWQMAAKIEKNIKKVRNNIINSYCYSVTQSFAQSLTINGAVSAGMRHASLSHGLDASQAVVVVVVAVEVLSESNGEDGEEAQNEVHVDRE